MNMTARIFFDGDWTYEASINGETELNLLGLDDDVTDEQLLDAFENEFDERDYDSFVVVVER